MSFQSNAVAHLAQSYPNLMGIVKKMDDSMDANHYNPDHPCSQSKLSVSVHPAGVLMRLSLQIAIQNPENIKDLIVPSDDFWKYLGMQCKSIQKITKQVNTSILSLGNKWDLRTFLQHRVPHVISN